MSIRIAPWILVEGDITHYARLKVLQTVRDALEERVSQITLNRAGSRPGR
jgi:polyphosphate kinase 2 (PPK2 family)